MSNIIFEAKKLSKQYGTSMALKDINMTIRAGEIYGLVGENGAGKTTLMNVISGLVVPSSGLISLFGEHEKSKLSIARKKIGVLIEAPALYPDLNAQENLFFYSKIFGIKNEQKAITTALEIVSLIYGDKKRVSEFSLGMRQRLGLAVALLNNPQLLVLDEPINGLDPAGIVDIRNILELLVRERGVTILISSHILSELQLLTTKVGFVHKGQLVKEIDNEELLKSSETQICIQVNDPSYVSEMLSDELHLQGILINGEIHISKENTNMETIMAFLLQKGVEVRGINLSSPNLENYYMELIGGQKQ